jgi:D-allose transport system substrate-binding protein
MVLALTFCMVFGVVSSSLAAPKIAIVLKTLANPFWVAMKEGIEEEAKKQKVQVDIYSVPTEGDIKAQADLLDSILQKDYDGLGVAPLTPVNLIPGVVRANKAGILVVNIDEAINSAELANQGGKVISFVTTNNVKVGAQAAQFVIKTVGQAGGEVAIIEGMSGNVSGNDRRDGFRADIVKASGFKLVASQPGNWDRVTALNVASNMLQRFPNLKAIYCCNDTMALGAAQAVQNAGKKGVVVVGTDGIPEAIAAINEGRLTATVAQDPGEVGAESLRLLLVALSGKQVPTRADVPSKLIIK